MLFNENKIKCVKCETILISESDQHLQPCTCGHVKIGGGKNVSIRLLADGSPAKKDQDFVELSSFVLNE
jgi:hypothetical protein